MFTKSASVVAVRCNAPFMLFFMLLGTEFVTSLFEASLLTLLKKVKLKILQFF
jgi:hypothetical protein